MKQYKAEDHTFVICAYKESPYLEDCIRSVLHQNVRGKICLTTSTPNQYIAALAQKYQIPVFANPVSEGIAADWNFAVASAKTWLVTLAHQDDCTNRPIRRKLYRRQISARIRLFYFPTIGSCEAIRKVRAVL